MPAKTTAHFRFGDLPKEIRNKIYCELLCNFRPQPTTVEFTLDFTPALRDIHTAILLTNKTIYLEAYDVLVKTNRFVKVTSVYGMPLQMVINGLRTPIVSSDPATVDNFKGYVLAIDFDFTHEIDLSARDNTYGSFDPRALMILHRDLDTFCQALTDGDAHDPNFSSTLDLTVTVAPNFTTKPPASCPSPIPPPSFTDLTQTKLLAPFRTHLRGLPNVHLHGSVDPTIAAAFRADLASPRCSDPSAVLVTLRAAKQQGNTLSQQGQREQSCLAWQDAAVDIDKLHASNSWPALLAHRDAMPFVEELAQLYFLLQLNIAHAEIANLQPTSKSTLPAMFSGIMAEDALGMAMRSLRRDYWMEGFKYKPEGKHVAKLRYRWALLIRLQGERGKAEEALRHVDAALRLVPGDVAVVKEREAILAWMGGEGA